MTRLNKYGEPVKRPGPDNGRRTMKPAKRAELLEDALAIVVAAYTYRFEGNGPGKLFGPIDEEIIAARKLLRG